MAIDADVVDSDNDFLVEADIVIDSNYTLLVAAAFIVHVVDSDDAFLVIASFAPDVIMICLVLELLQLLLLILTIL
jgi:hypothetical protein